jgi:hypothetical protein
VSERSSYFGNGPAQRDRRLVEHLIDLLVAPVEEALDHRPRLALVHDLPFAGSRIGELIRIGSSIAGAPARLLSVLLLLVAGCSSRPLDLPEPSIAPVTFDMARSPDSGDVMFDMAPSPDSGDVTFDMAPSPDFGDVTFDMAPSPDLMTPSVPRLLAPLSTSTVTSQQPTFKWTLPAGASNVAVVICHDRACADKLSTAVSIDASSTSGSPVAALPAGVLFWHVTASVGGTQQSSATWEVWVGTRTATKVSSSFGTILDVNGDGYADVIIGAPDATNTAGVTAARRVL